MISIALYGSRPYQHLGWVVWCQLAAQATAPTATAHRSALRRCLQVPAAHGAGGGAGAFNLRSMVPNEREWACMLQPAFPHSLDGILFSYSCVFMVCGVLIFRQNPEGLPHVATIRCRLLQPPAPAVCCPSTAQLRGSYFVSQSASHPAVSSTFRTGPLIEEWVLVM